MQIIPAIDIIEGQCVRLVEGEFSTRTNYSNDPAVMAEQFLRAGARHLHVVDLEGAKEGRVVNWKSIERILSVKGLEVQVGGGIRADVDIDRLLRMGAARVVVGSVAVRSPETVKPWAEKFGAETLCIALDLKDGRLAYDGWQNVDARRLSDVVPVMLQSGINRFLSTDIRRDGTLAGPNLELYSMLVRTYPQAQWFASGGVHSVENVRALKSIGVAGVIIGKAFYEGTLRVEELIGASC
ncbi:MAG: 1-(5-phosphoribosyl)-5-[(5-phosphoribosylamino)methylideneamino]imidazole-4-carboxamide isomerase [Ignavibacteria bacterium]|nr:1-(5-phosphoribosyl)-5-[(5-phosphoribosylamino)methylideneamino]imidazole-4-carboxamide isomerase [Ignavibacteria bacterium]